MFAHLRNCFACAPAVGQRHLRCGCTMAKQELGGSEDGKEQVGLGLRGWGKGKGQQMSCS